MASLINRLQNSLGSLFGDSKNIAASAHYMGPAASIDYEDDQSVVPFDETLLERSRTQWQFGDWESLTRLARDTPQHHHAHAAAGYFAFRPNPPDHKKKPNSTLTAAKPASVQITSCYLR